jgi:predicted Zn finger-like uncharacterized protein
VYTRCPQCKTIYRITAAQLRAGRGEALCERCHIVFNALTALTPTANNPIPDLTRQPGQQRRMPSLGSLEAVSRARFEQEQLDELAKLERPPVRKPQPSSREGTQRRGREASSPRRFPWGLWSLAFLLLLIAQVVFFEGRRLAQDPLLRPWLNLACETLGCVLPPYKDVPRIQIYDRTLHTLSGGENGFEFRLVFANQSNLPQAFPKLKLVLSEINGRTVAERIFEPPEYLAGQPGDALMPVGKPFEVRLLLAKPGRDIGGFAFDLI